MYRLVSWRLSGRSSTGICHGLPATSSPLNLISIVCVMLWNKWTLGPKLVQIQDFIQDLVHLCGRKYSFVLSVDDFSYSTWHTSSVDHYFQISRSRRGGVNCKKQLLDSVPNVLRVKFLVINKTCYLGRSTKLEIRTNPWTLDNFFFRKGPIAVKSERIFSRSSTGH